MSSIPFELSDFQDKTSKLVSLFFESKKNSNCILELEELFLSENETCIVETSAVLRQLFSKIFSNGMLSSPTNQGENEEKYHTWLLDRYNDFVSHLLEYLSHRSSEVRESALDTLIVFVTLEAKDPLKIVENHTWHFPSLLFQKILKELLSFDINQEDLISKFETYTPYDDITFFTWKCVLSILENAEKMTDVFLENCFLLLCSIKYPEQFLDKNEAVGVNENTLLHQNGVEILFHLREKEVRKLFSSVWLKFLKYELPLPLFQKVLMQLDETVLPYLHNPSLMTDFLSKSYSKGGVTSLLSLKGLFLLMQKYNVEYPDFYAKLYALFDENIVNGKHSARFFQLSNLFLSSTHLPAYIVASFAKRLSRISLRSKASTNVKIVPFICNLVMRHPTLNVLFHREDPKELSSDPFKVDEPDPSKSNAMDSAFWEMRTLEEHYYFLISRKASATSSALPKLEYDTSKLLDVNSRSLYRRETKRKYSAVPLSIQHHCDKSFWKLKK